MNQQCNVVNEHALRRRRRRQQQQHSSQKNKREFNTMIPIPTILDT